MMKPIATLQPSYGLTESLEFGGLLEHFPIAAPAEKAMPLVSFFGLDAPIFKTMGNWKLCCDGGKDSRRTLTLPDGESQPPLFPLSSHALTCRTCPNPISTSTSIRTSTTIATAAAAAAAATVPWRRRRRRWRRRHQHQH